MKVVKFGGSSVASASQIRKICDIIVADPARRIVVVSAPGKRSSDDVKVTDLLIQCAQSMLDTGASDQEASLIIDRFKEIQEGLDLPVDILEEIRATLTAAIEADRSHPGMYMDAMKAIGEDCCARVTAAALRKMGHDATYVNPGDAGMLLSDEFGQAQLLPESYESLASLKAHDGIVVFPGFFGYTKSGELATFPRGGSDITGSILAAAVDAECYENFTDVDCVRSIDPRVVPDAEAINEMTFSEMRELSYAGFSVVHAEALIPVVQKGIPVNVRNTNRPEAPGTWIRGDREALDGKVIGIACNTGFSMLYLSKYMMNREVGFGRRLLQILEEEGLTYEHMPSGIDNVSLILKSEQLTVELTDKVLARIMDELKVEQLTLENDLALIMVVGQGRRNAVGVASRATRALADAEVSIEMMNQGSSEISMMFGVKDHESDAAVKSLYTAFF